jgi:hypothetical protein
MSVRRIGTVPLAVVTGEKRHDDKSARNLFYEFIAATTVLTPVGAADMTKPSV